MNKKAPPRSVKRNITGVPNSGQQHLLEFYEFSKGVVMWRLWISYNLDRTHGTYLVLHRDGMITRETVQHDGGTVVAVIKPKEKL